jgi:hypothetical protein
MEPFSNVVITHLDPWWINSYNVDYSQNNLLELKNKIKKRKIKNLKIFKNLEGWRTIKKIYFIIYPLNEHNSFFRRNSNSMFFVSNELYKYSRKNLKKIPSVIHINSKYVVRLIDLLEYLNWDYEREIIISMINNDIDSLKLLLLNNFKEETDMIKLISYFLNDKRKIIIKI